MEFGRRTRGDAEMQQWDLGTGVDMASLETENRPWLEQRAISFCKETKPFRSLKTLGSAF